MVNIPQHIHIQSVWVCLRRFSIASMNAHKHKKTWKWAFTIVKCMQTWGLQFKPWKFPSWEQCIFDYRLPKRVCKFHAMLAQLKGLFGLNAMILFSTRNVINKKSCKVLFGRHYWTIYVKLEWNRTSTRIRTFPKSKHDCLNSFDKAWGRQFLLYNRDYLDVRWSCCLPKMGKFL